VTAKDEKWVFLARLGRRIRFVREAYESAHPLHHSQSQWASYLGITPEMMNRIENGKAEAPAHILARIFIGAGVSPAFYYTGVLEKTPMTLKWLYVELSRILSEQDDEEDEELKPISLDRWLKRRAHEVKIPTKGQARNPAYRGHRPYRKKRQRGSSSSSA
jgi:transcriptional regulator with XRE-family HTH domain